MREATRKPNAFWALLCLPLFWIGHRVGLVAGTPLWLLLVLMAIAYGGSTVAQASLPSPARGWRLWLRIGIEMAGITAVIYALGWGPTLAVGYVFGAVDNLDGDGAAVAAPAIVCSSCCIVAGQLAIALHVAPSLVAQPLVHGLAVLCGLGAAVTIRLVVWETRAKERAQDVAERSEAWFRALVQHASDVILVVDANARIAYASPAFAQVFGAPVSAVVGLEARELAQPDDLAAARVVQGTADRPGQVHRVQLRLAFKGERWRWFEAGVTNLLDDPAVRGIVVNLRDITERRGFEEQLRHQAFHDLLTELPNRGAFVDRVHRSLARAERAGERIAVLFLDVDRFKLVNDSLGHDIGDRLLVEVARRLGRCVRPNDLVARFGGDEFTILLDQLPSVDDAIRTAERILDVLRLPVVAGGRELFVTTSIGIAVSRDDGTGAGELLREADLAMYVAKEKGRARYELFDVDRAPRVAERLEAEAELWHAVQHGQLTVYYQPEMSLGGGELVGLEALVRWTHPERGLLLPDAFLPLAEESSLVVAIDRFVLRSACLDGRRWSDAYGVAAPRVSVNLSTRFLRQLEAVDEIETALHDTGFDPALLQLEVTEHAAVTDEERTFVALDRIRSLGVQVAIDDFGTGYASLDYLKRLPVDAVKLDHSFVAGLERVASDAAIIQAVITMAHALGLRVTAEGVERPEQAAVLRSLGCDLAQGLHFAPPAPASTVDRLLEPAAVVNLRAERDAAS
ncbi:MAG TPA: EAL domain-containing protein [Acidimicrobiia bacterium]|jgi:diguanylate cyclase (GGDEF)-like protein/PAS domain S-box-containing protein